MANISWSIQFKTVLKIMLVFFHVALFLSLIVHFKTGGTLSFGNHTMTGRLGGLFFFAVTAVLAGFASLISFYLVLINRRVIYIISLALCIAYLIYTDSRSVLLGVIVGCFIQYFFNLKIQKKKTTKTIVFFIVFYVLYRIYSAYNLGGANVEDDLEFRTKIWSTALLGIYQEPYLGYGDSLYFLTNMNYALKDFYEQLNDPHSSYLALILQSGLIAFFMLFYFLYRILKGMVLKPNIYNLFVISLFGFWLISGSTGGAFFNLNYSLLSVLFNFTLIALAFHPSLWPTNSIRIKEVGLSSEKHENEGNFKSINIL
ncbi:O-antigen ligase family protein [Arcticibacter svalbardensis]|nr:O-antigen ligase family protein [Arcticibacter svalbardensis]